MESSKRLKIFLACITLGPLFGYLLTSFWFAGGGTFWQPIDYFPHPVATILNLQPYGNEFWVTTTDGVTYHILYPCQEAAGCWQEDEEVTEICKEIRILTSLIDQRAVEDKEVSEEVNEATEEIEANDNSEADTEVEVEKIIN